MEKIKEFTLIGLDLNELFFTAERLEENKVLKYRKLDRAAKNIRNISNTEWFDESFFDLVQNREGEKISDLLLDNSRNRRIYSLMGGGYVLPYVRRHKEFVLKTPGEEMLEVFRESVVDAVVNAKDPVPAKKALTVLAEKVIAKDIPDELLQKAIEGMAQNIHTPVWVLDKLSKKYKNPVLESIVKSKNEETGFSFVGSVDDYVNGKISEIVINRGMEEMLTLGSYVFTDETRGSLSEEKMDGFIRSEKIIGLKETVEGYSMNEGNIRILPNIPLNEEKELFKILKESGGLLGGSEQGEGIESLVAIQQSAPAEVNHGKMDSPY